MKIVIEDLRQKWIGWSQRSVNRRIFAASVTVGVLTVCVSLASFAKELVVAFHFGTSDELDAFLIAFLLPAFAISVVAGSINAAFIPTYVSVKERQGDEAAQQLFSSVFILSLVILSLVCVLLALVVHVVLPHLASGFSTSKLSLTESLFFSLLPILFIGGIAMLYASVLNASEQFAIAAIAPIAVPLTTIAALYVLGRRYGIYALALGMITGFCLQMTVLSVLLIKRKVSLRPKWAGMSPQLKNVMGQYIPVVAGAFMMGSTTLVDRSMATMLDSGSVSALSYGNKIISFVVGSAAMALGTAVLPHCSRMVAKEDWSGIRHTLRMYTRLILWGTIPLAVILIIFSEKMVGLIFERGMFTHNDTVLVGKIQALYFLQIPFYVLGILLVRLISSLNKNKILFFGALISFFLNILLNLIFMKWLGVAGIALSTSIVYLVSCVYIGLVLNRYIPGYK